MQGDKSVTDAIIRAMNAVTATQTPHRADRQQISPNLPTTYDQVSAVTRSHDSSLMLPNSTASSSSSSGPSANSNDQGHSSRDGQVSIPERKRKLILPTMFQSKKSKGRSETSTRYLRDIFCLPKECMYDDGGIAIPRGTRRNALASPDVG